MYYICSISFLKMPNQVSVDFVSRKAIKKNFNNKNVFIEGTKYAW